ncbi:MAG TPA: LEPR-XLL domain-containing protein, partial [Nitrospiraceae bacterium]|nr:LEPR-XLL domain-containing protein [Nitrospiraceae bacterium]
MNEHTNEQTKMGRQSTSKERKAARHTRGESKYRLELLESRLLLSADIIAAVPAAPLAAPQPTMTVAEMLARPSSSFAQ